MTREIFTPSPLYTIATAGPHPITHPYQVDTEIACTIFSGITILELVNGVDFTVSPSGSETIGDVTLSAGIFAAYTGASLLIRRVSVSDQGWAGQTARERGLESQLDGLTQRLQEIDEAVGRAIKLPSDPAPEFQLDTSNLWLGFDASNVLTAGIPATTTLLTTAYSATLLDDPDAKTARATLAIFDTTNDLKADTTTTTNMPVGTIVEAGGFRYSVAASGGDITTAGGVQVVHSGQNNVFSILAYDPVADGVTDDATKIDLANVIGHVVDLGGKTLSYIGTLVASATFVNGKITDSNRTFDYSLATGETKVAPSHSRARLDYGSATAIRVFLAPKIVLGGFRFMGAYQDTGREVLTGVAGSVLIDSSGSGLAAESAPVAANWYAVFAAANLAESTATLTQMPFIRAGSVSGSVATLCQFGDTDGETVTAESYAWATDSLVGARVLIITEAGVWSGRTTTVTANTTTTVTLASIGSVASLDKMLIAPPNYTEFAYLGAHYLDSAGGESRNIADTGSTVGSLGNGHPTFPSTGVITNTRYSWAGMVSPLATAVKFKLQYSLSTASTGTHSHSFDHDSSSHVLVNSYVNKEGAGTITIVDDGLYMEFSKEQASWISSAGSLSAAVTGRTLQIRGWFEP